MTDDHYDDAQRYFTPRPYPWRRLDSWEIDQWLANWRASPQKTNLSELIRRHIEEKEKRMIEFEEWEIWNGHGEPPKGRVQVHLGTETRVRAEQSRPKCSECFEWENVIAFRRVKEPVRDTVESMVSSDGIVTPAVWDRHPLVISIPRKDGKAIPGTYTSEAGDKIVITENTPCA